MAQHTHWLQKENNPRMKYPRGYLTGSTVALVPGKKCKNSLPEIPIRPEVHSISLMFIKKIENIIYKLYTRIIIEIGKRVLICPSCNFNVYGGRWKYLIKITTLRPNGNHSKVSFIQFLRFLPTNEVVNVSLN